MAWPTTDMSARNRTSWASDMSALCVAVNQRKAALGRSATSFKINTGGTTAYPTASQLAGMTFHKDFQNNLVTLQTATKALTFPVSATDTWTSTLGGTSLSHSSIISSIGLGDFPASPSISNGNNWERIREYLHRLKYLRIVLTSVLSPTVDYKQYTETPFVSNDTTWNAVKAAAFTNGNPSSFGLASLFIGWGNGTTGLGRATVADNAVGSYLTSVYDGVASSGSLQYAWSGTFSTLSAPVSVSVAGAAKTFTTGSSTTGTGTPSVTVSVATNTAINMSITTAEPTGSPWQTATPGGAVGGFSVFAQNLSFNLDLSTVLTDQA